MKSKDQRLLEEAYNEVKAAKVERYATPQELKLIRDYIDDSGIDLDVDLSEGWVWNLKNFVPTHSRLIYVTTRDKSKASHGKSFEGYTSFLINPISSEVYWGGHTTFEGMLSVNAIKIFELENEFPEVKGTF